MVQLDRPEPDRSSRPSRPDRADRDWRPLSARHASSDRVPGDWAFLAAHHHRRGCDEAARTASPQSKCSRRPSARSRRTVPMRTRGSLAGPLVLIIIGLLFLIHAISPSFRIGEVFAHYWPFLLIF